MAVAIVGTDQRAVKRCTCSNCASILEYTLADTVQRTSRDYGGGSDNYRELVCPKCLNKISVSNY